MASSGGNPGDVFDIRKIRRLVELMNEHELAEIDLRQGEHRIRLRKGHGPLSLGGPSASGGATHPAPTAGAAPVPAEPPRPATDDRSADENVKYVTSPMVGTFYVAPNPEAAPLIQVGDRVGPDTTVCIIEAMKVFNEIQAECSGTVAAVLVENGEPIEFGQKLFKIVSET